MARRKRVEAKIGHNYVADGVKFCIEGISDHRVGHVRLVIYQHESQDPRMIQDILEGPIKHILDEIDSQFNLLFSINGRTK